MRTEEIQEAEFTSDDPMDWLAMQDKRWLLVVGSHLSASSGVPLPFYQTAWSPSIRELVRYHVFQTQSREAASGIEQQLAAGKPPLGMIADSLKGQKAWLKQHIEQLMPLGPILYIAELAKHGMFQGIVSAAYDDLLPKALNQLRVRWSPCTLESPRVPHHTLPLLREYDDTLFQDTAAHRQQEARFLRERISGLLEEVDGVWLIGHPPYDTDLFVALKESIANKDELMVVWTQEKLRLTPSAFGGHPPGDPANWVDMFGPRAAILHAEDLSLTLHQLSERRELPPSQLVHKASQPGITGLLNRTVDMRPVLVYIPGVSLFGEALKKLPRVSLRALFSVAVLLLLILAGFHYKEYSAFRSQLTKPQNIFAHATKQMAMIEVTKGAKLPGLLQVEKQLTDAKRAWRGIKISKDPLFVMPQLTKQLLKQHRGFFKRLTSYRDDQLLPKLYRARRLDQIQNDRLMQGLSTFPDVTVVRYRLPTRSTRKKRTLWIERRYPLSHFAKRPRLVLRASNAILLQLIQHKQMLRELRKGRLVFTFDLRDKMRLEEQLERQAHRLLQRKHDANTKRKDDLEGIRKWLRAGKSTFLFEHLDTAGSVSRQLSRIEELLVKYPKCRIFLTTYRERSSRHIARRAKQWLQLSIKSYRYYEAKRYLQQHTSHTFFEGAMSNAYVRWNWDEPLVMAMLLEYHRDTGRAPRGLGVLYDRLLRRMLIKRRFSTQRKFQILARIAYHSMKYKRPKFSIAQVQHWHKGAKDAPSIEVIGALLREATQQAVLRRYGPSSIGFIDKRARMLFAAKHLHNISFAKRKAFLQQHSTLFMSIYIGVQPNADRLVKAWLDDFDAIQRLLKAQEREHSHVNPTTPTLIHAALAVRDGDVDTALGLRLEALLLRWLQHVGTYNSLGLQMTKTLSLALSFLGTQGVKRQIIDGIERDDTIDHRYLSLTARSSSDIYDNAVMRWLIRLRTPRDKQEIRRAYSKAAWAKPQAKRGLPYKLPHRFQIAVKNAINTLIQSGSPAGLNFVRRFLSQDRDPRFRAKTWHKIRKHGIMRLLTNGRGQYALPLFARIASNAPGKWFGLFTKLRHTPNAKAADLLVSIIKSDVPNIREYMRRTKARKRYIIQRKAHMKTSLAYIKQIKKALRLFKRQMRANPKLSLAQKRKLAMPLLKMKRAIQKHRKAKPKDPFPPKQKRKLRSAILTDYIAKRRAAWALALLPKHIGEPRLKAIATQRQTEKQIVDTRYLGVYGLSHLDDPTHLKIAKQLIEERLRQPLPTHIPRTWRSEEAEQLSTSLGRIGNAAAWKLYLRLYRNKRWRDIDFWLDTSLTDFVIPEARRYAIHQLLCAKKSDDHSWLIRNLAKHETLPSRNLINRLLALATVGDEPSFRKRTCKGTLLPFQTIKKRLSLYSLIAALASFREPNDIPRLMQYARHKKSLVRDEALGALQKNYHPTVTQFLWRAFLRMKKPTYAVRKSLKTRRRKLDEHLLLDAFAKAQKIRYPYVAHATRAYYKKMHKDRIRQHKRLKELLAIMAVHGGWASLKALQPIQENHSLQRSARSTTLKIAARIQGSKRWNRRNLLQLLAGPKPTTNTTQKTRRKTKPKTNNSPTSRPKTR